MKIVLTSKNKAKRMAVERVFLKIDPAFELICVEVESGVSVTPTNDNEGIDGSINRINAGKLLIKEADYYIGLEGIITKNAAGVFICGWCAIECPRLLRIGFGCSGKVMIPEYIAQEIRSFGELSNLIKDKYPSALVEKIDSLGSNGIITNSMYARADEFEDAINCALGYILNDKNYPS